MKKRVDFETYTAKYDTAIAGILSDARRFVLELVPEADESFKWSHPWYELHGSFCYIMGYTEHVNLGFPRGAELVDGFPILEGTGKDMRHVKIRTSEDLLAPVIADLVKAAVDLNSSRT